nr:Chain X, Envelope glycoprotein B [Human alphaherpesvirus 1 strain KOS]3WV0_Y Chain Y, Envelope glycoprotein B [Human alphaherpesvirus 1 strain KOS]5XO2_X Chain X, Peptide from Envelope glycoprotein B [Human alphaherpesvirus 1 strain KOS]5XO2_Y Chain Y, Peptide from Envelope glycoprotein B [Human alphaherpesvirus 1 strain KOS]5XOF_O Chain O, Peptide from Nitric oxide synthase, endothelial [Homo sapiens]5XOF_P Chain P, Peptide from Nitric oxide synthase, endothelial [Homo sapiens]5XOF_Q Chai
GPATPAP